MPQIVQLEQHIADLIAAGEVVSRPASVVKELLENSIDAGAGIVTVEISSGGMAYIRITDDGSGIAPDDAKTAFLRHATSKLQDKAGLEAIETLGFRGEALAAIAAVSRIELVTRTADANEGVRLLLEAGTPLSFTPAGCPVGTTIIVRDLFFNTPARLKFMKTDRAEGSAVSSVVMRCALSRPDISFRYIKDGKTEFHTPGDSRVDSCVYNLLGREIGLGFIPVNLSDEYVSVKGFTSSPSDARGNRGYQFFFINGRVVRSLLLQSALEQAYKNKILSGRFPACVLYVTMGANNVDVNVHPAKTEVRFISDKQVFDGVYYAVLGALEQGGGGGGDVLERGGDGGGGSHEVSRDGSRSVSHDGGGVSRGNYGGGGGSGVYGGGFENLRVDDYLRRYKKDGERFSPGAYGGKARMVAPTHNGAAASFDAPAPDETTRQLSDIEYFRVIGEVLDSYIVCQYEDAVWFIDKHAAHERIRFDALTNGEYEPMSESLISPVVCRIGCDGASLLLENAAFLDSLGFAVESFGEDSVAVRYIPSYIHQRDVESVLTEICDTLERGETSGQGNAPSSATLEKIYKTLACGAAIKAGSDSNMQELEALAERVLSGEISHCPHGRPVAFALTKAALEKRFDRI